MRLGYSPGARIVPRGSGVWPEIRAIDRFPLFRKSGIGSSPAPARPGRKVLILLFLFLFLLLFLASKGLAMPSDRRLDGV